MAFIAHAIIVETDIAAINYLAVSGLTKSQLETIVDYADMNISGNHSQPLVAQPQVTRNTYDWFMEAIGRRRAERLVDMCVRGHVDEVLSLREKFVGFYNFYLGTKVAKDYVRLGRRVDFTVQGPVEIYLKWVAEGMNSAMGGDPSRGPWASVLPYHPIGSQQGAAGGKVVRVDLGRSTTGVGDIHDKLEQYITFSGQAGKVGFLTPAAQHG